MRTDDLFVDPDTHEPLQRATDTQLAAITTAIEARRARRRDGGDIPSEIRGAYLSHGNRWVYADVDGFPSFLIEERIELDEPV